MRIIAVLLAAFLAIPAFSQEPPKIGPEHEMLGKRAGIWDTVMKAGGGEFKGVMTYRMDLGGLWLAGSMESDLGGQKFSGRSLETYDSTKKKFVGVWVDNMGTTPMLSEGTWDADKKVLTTIGDGPGSDGKPSKWKSVYEIPDNDTVLLSMFVGTEKEPMFTVSCKRRK